MTSSRVMSFQPRDLIYQGSARIDSRTFSTTFVDGRRISSEICIPVVVLPHL